MWLRDPRRPVLYTGVVPMWLRDPRRRVLYTGVVPMSLKDPRRPVLYGENLLFSPAPGSCVLGLFLRKPFKLIKSSGMGRSMMMGLQSFCFPVTLFPERSVLIIMFVDRHSTGWLPLTSNDTRGIPTKPRRDWC